MVHPEMLDLWHQQMQASHFGWAEEDYASAHAAMPKVLEFARVLHEAGVTLLPGND